MNEANIHQVSARLRSDPSIQEHFDMLTWGKDDVMASEGCSTVACYGGWAVLILAPDEVTYRNSDRRTRAQRRSCDFELVIRGRPDVSLADRAQELLGLDAYIAAQLFVPWDCWEVPLVQGWYVRTYQPFWTPNTRPPLETVEAMKEWAGKFQGHLSSDVTASWAADTAEDILNHPGWVDWRPLSQRELQVA